MLPTDTPSPKGISPFLRPFSRKSSKSLLVADSSASPEGMLRPKLTSRSTGSEDSHSIRSRRSIRSSTIRGKKLFKGVLNRYRSSSNLRAAIDPLQEFEKLQEGESWIKGFSQYNQLVTCLVSKEHAYPPEQFANICESFTKKCGGGFVHGLPEAVFDLSLLWCPSKRLSRKPVGTMEPSWSWRGWEAQNGGEGGVNFPFDPTTCPDVRGRDKDFFRSEIDYYKLEPTEDESNDGRVQPYTVRRQRGLKIGLSSYSVPHGHEAAKNSQALRFKAFTVSAEGFIAKQIADEDREIPCSELLDKDDRQCGILMDYADLISVPCSKPGKFEFALLSRNRYVEPDKDTTAPAASAVHHPPGTPVWNGDRFLWEQHLQEYDETFFKSGEWNVLNVMLIQHFEEEGYAERVAIARIHEDAWNALKPQRRDIVLR